MPKRPLSEITAQAIKLLSREIGIVSTIRFVNQFTTGYGNYTEERSTLFGEETLDGILSEIEANRAYDQAKASGGDAVPFEDAVREIERDRGME